MILVTLRTLTSHEVPTLRADLILSVQKRHYVQSLF